MTKPGRIVNVDEAIAADRRQFVRGVGVAVLSVQMLPVIVRAAAKSPGDGTDPAKNLIIHSGPGLLGHVHDLLVPYAVLKTPPPEGVELTSTKAFLHTHNIKLSQEDLETITHRGTVTKKSSSHIFLIALADRQDQSHSGARNQS